MAAIQTIKSFRQPFSLLFLKKNEVCDAFQVPGLTTLLCLSLFICLALLHLVHLSVCVNISGRSQWRS